MGRCIAPAMLVALSTFLLLHTSLAETVALYQRPGIGLNELTPGLLSSVDAWRHLLVGVKNGTLSVGATLTQLGVGPPESGVKGDVAAAPLDHHWPPLRFDFRNVLGGVLCSLGATLSSAAGVGGGGLFVPIFNLALRYDAKTSTALSQAVIAAGSLVSISYNIKRKHPSQDTSLVDFDLVMLFIPALLTGITVGVVLNQLFPTWCIILLLTVLLGYMSFLTLRKGLRLWDYETKLAMIQVKRDQSPIPLPPEEEAYQALDANMVGSEGMEGHVDLLGEAEKARGGSRNTNTVPLLRNLREYPGSHNPVDKFKLPVEEMSIPVPWPRVWQAAFIWLVFFGLQVLKGGKSAPSVFGITSCDWQYWALDLVQIPIAVAFIWAEGCRLIKHEEIGESEGGVVWTKREVVRYPAYAFVAGTLVGMLGIGGGMLINPLLLELGVIPQVTAATSFVLIFFCASMAAAQFAIMGQMPVFAALVFSAVCAVSSWGGNSTVRLIVAKQGRASIIVFALAGIMITSTALIGILGGANTIYQLEHGASWGFHPLCKRGV